MKEERGKKKRIFDQNKYCQKLEHGFISTSAEKQTLLIWKLFCCQFSSSCFSRPASSQQDAAAIPTPGSQLWSGSRQHSAETRQQRGSLRAPEGVNASTWTPPSEGSGQFITALSLCQGEPLGHVCSIYKPVREEEWQSPPVGQHPGLPTFSNWLSFHWESFGLRAFVVISDTNIFIHGWDTQAVCAGEHNWARAWGQTLPHNCSALGALPDTVLAHGGQCCPRQCPDTVWGTAHPAGCSQQAVWLRPGAAQGSGATCGSLAVPLGHGASLIDEGSELLLSCTKYRHSPHRRWVGNCGGRGLRNYSVRQVSTMYLTQTRALE